MLRILIHRHTRFLKARQRRRSKHASSLSTAIESEIHYFISNLMIQEVKVNKPYDREKKVSEPVHFFEVYFGTCAMKECDKNLFTQL